MPSLTFVLPHWLYWAGLLLFPLAAMFILSRRSQEEPSNQVTASIAYFLLFTGGFAGLHRFYLRSRLGWLFIPLFIAVLFLNVEIRDGRNALSKANNEQTRAEFMVERAEKRLSQGYDNAEEQLAEAKDDLASAADQIAAAENHYSRLNVYVKAVGGLILALLVLDAVLIPRLVRRCAELDARDPVHKSTFVCPPSEAQGTGEDPTLDVHTRITDAIDRMNFLAGSMVAYWSPIAVIVYYYEVLARYVFNSPTNWAHEGMFLMFGMQYLIAGGFCLREDAHVRVDVIYSQLSARTKALVDVITSTFFFIFVVALLWTGWIFFSDSWQVREVSFTEWGVQYWPVKLAIPLGATLLLIQGLARLSKDILVLTGGPRRGA